jgi:hypothetical protein
LALPVRSRPLFRVTSLLHRRAPSRPLPPPPLPSPRQSASHGYKDVTDNRGKFVLAHAASGHKRALQSVFADATVLARLSDTRAAAEVLALQVRSRRHTSGGGGRGASACFTEYGAHATNPPPPTHPPPQDFFKAFRTDAERAYYGYRHTRLAADRGAVRTLLISDGLFRAREADVRRAYVRLVSDVEAAGGEVRVFSSAHVSGEQLSQITGVAALLRFPIPDMEDASAPYAATVHHRHHGTGAGGGAGEEADGEEGGGGGGGGAGGGGAWEVASDSDGSSDSDASYKRGGGGGGRGAGGGKGR